MAEPILKLTRGVPRTDREWMDVFSKLTKHLRVVGDQLVIEPDVHLPEASVGTDELEDASVTDVKLRESQACSVMGRSLNTAGSPTDIQASTNGHFLRRSGDVLSFGAIADSDIPSAIARDTEVAQAISNHEAAADPHPGYTTAAELSAAISALNLASGTYTPTFSNVLNLDGSIPAVAQYLRVGSVVTVSGSGSMNPTAAGETRLGISLPIASNFAAVSDCAGVGSFITINESGGIWGDTANDRAVFQLDTANTDARDFYFTFTYQVL